MILGQRSSLVMAIALLVLATAHADQLPAPPSGREQYCSRIFEQIEIVLTSAMNFFYSLGTRDRDELANRMVEFSGMQALVSAYKQECSANAQDTIRALAYHLIAQRFGDSK